MRASPRFATRSSRSSSVKVTKVNTLNRPGKIKTNRRRNTAGRTSATKRALVTLAEGNEIALFES
jgi:ribosomal protein L23